MQETQAGMPDAAGDWATERAVEAARYALLRRLAHAMRHHMVVHLQPIGMITEVVERRLRSPAPDLAQVHESMRRINGFSRSAVQSCLEVVSWLAPEGGAVVALDAGVAECLAMLRSNFNFRGFTLKDEVGTAAAPVARSGLRNVLPACLLALTDRAVSPADIVVRAELRPMRALLSISLRAGDGSAGFAGDAPYRLLEWGEVQALARADGLGFEREGTQVRLTLPLAAA
ncbi:MAG TPA: hypothetical protein VNN06_08470 [Ramlibacter sp.]|nr:hypothetical protein [Ramlibacter sp.]